VKIKEWFKDKFKLLGAIGEASLVESEKIIRGKKNDTKER